MREAVGEAMRAGSFGFSTNCNERHMREDGLPVLPGECRLARLRGHPLPHRVAGWHQAGRADRAPCLRPVPAALQALEEEEKRVRLRGPHLPSLTRQDLA